MIPQAYLIAWRSSFPWGQNAQIEQDLIISRAIVDISSNPILSQNLAFRGGTALHKIFFQKPLRYSEDIDLVQVKAQAIGSVITALRQQLDPWLGAPRWEQKEGRVTLYFRVQSEEPITQLRLKIEINTQEHFTELGYTKVNNSVKSPWFTGECQILNYQIEELLGTKLRALYQRKKGRDLFDLVKALEHFKYLEREKVIRCFRRYLAVQGLTVTRAQFERNLFEKKVMLPCF